MLDPDQVIFAVHVLQEHEGRIASMFQSVLQAPVTHYTDSDGKLDRDLVALQLTSRSCLLQQLAAQLGKLEQHLYAAVTNGLVGDYGGVLQEFGSSLDQFEQREAEAQAAGGRIQPAEAATG